MSKTVHYLYGCAWADGEISCSDTNQTPVWEDVTCGHCLNNRLSGYGNERRAESWQINSDTGEPSEDYFKLMNRIK